MDVVLAIATILGGITALWFLWDKFVKRKYSRLESENPVLNNLKLSKYFFIVSKISGKCIEIENASLEDRANAIQNTITLKDNQKWEFVEVEQGYFKIITKHSQKCLDVQGARKQENRANVWQFNYHGGDNQKWKLVAAEDGEHFFIKSKYSEKCLDVQASRRTEDGANIWQYSSHGGDNQLWRIIPEVYGVIG